MTPTRMMVAILALGGLLVWALLFWDPVETAQRRADQPHVPLALASRPVGGDFELRSARGPVRLQALRGKVVLIYFGYTACPDICPTNLAYIASALRGLEQAELDKVQVIFVSVDPERDDLERLARYAAYFHPKILGATASPQQIAHVAALYGAAYRRVSLSESAMGYLVDHSAFTYVVDRGGRLVETLDHATAPDEIRAVVRTQLRADAAGLDR